MALRPVPQIDLFKKEKSAEEFLSLLPPDARPVVLPDGSVVIQQGSRTYEVPRSINNKVRDIVSNVTPLGQRTRTTVGSASARNVEVVDNTGDVVSTVESGSDFLTNVGGVGATTFDYDLSDEDLLEAIELRKSAYGVDTIETTTRINDQGNEEKGTLERIGDRLYEVFVSGPSQTITEVSPVSGKTIARSVPALEGVATAATMFTGFPMGQIANKVGQKFVNEQTADVEQAQLGVSGFGAVQVQDLSTGQIIDLTARPTGNAFTEALGLETGSVGTYAESMATGPFVTPDGQVFTTLDQAANYVGSNRFISSYVASTAVSPDGVFGDTSPSRTRVLDPGIERMGVYDPDDGTVDLGFNRKGEVTGIALDSQGNLNIKTGQGGFVTGMGEMITTGTGGIGFTGLRGDIVQGKNIDVRTASDFLTKVNEGTITSTPRTTEFLQGIIDENIGITTPPMTGIFGVPEINTIVQPPVSVETEFLPSFEDQVTEDIDTDTYQLETATPKNEEDYFSSIPEGGFFTDDDSDYSSDNSSDGGAASTSMGDSGFGGGGGFATAKGGRIGKQEGGTTVKPVSQIVQGAGFIAPQQNATDEQTIADDIPMEAEEGDFIINAPAAQFAGRQDIVDMILKAINSLKEKGVDIQYGNPKIPIKNRVQLAVSRNEVYIPKVIAEEIGYDKLEKINNRGKREVERRQQEAQQQANRGGFIRKANGGDIEDKSSMLLGTDDSNFLQDLGRAVINQLGDKIKGFLSKEEEMPTPTPRPENITAKQKEQDELKGVEKRPFLKKDEPKYTDFRNLISERKINLNLSKDREEAYDLLNLLEVSPKVDPRKGNVPSGSSGLTVGIGFDIGKHNEQDLKNFNFTESLYNKLLPYSLKLGDNVQVNPEFMLTDEELDEVNSVVLNKKYNDFEQKFPMYKDASALDKAVLYSVYHLGALPRYETFREVYDESRSIGNALMKGVIEKIKEKNSPERVRAEKALKWLRSKEAETMPTPRPRPKRIQARPDTRSFLSPQLSA